MGILRRKKNLSIIKVQNTYCDQNATITDLEKRIEETDLKLIELAKGLVEAKKVSVKTTFQSNSGILRVISRNLYRSMADESAKWHLQELNIKRKERQVLVKRLEKLKGTYISNTLGRWFRLAGLLIIGIMILVLIILGLVTTIYLLPTIVLILVIYRIGQRIRDRN